MKKLMIPLIAFLITLSSCENNQTKQKEDNPDKNLKVFAVNYPLQYFAERIGGEQIDLIYLIPENVDPAYWVPMQSLEKIQNVDLILANGANYAKWMEKVSLSSSKTVNTSEVLESKYIKEQAGETHSHGAGGDHVHYGYAFTTWLDFEMAIGQAKAILDAFIKKRPQHKENFTSNFNTLKAELNELNRRMTTVAEKLPETAIFASHPVYQYLGQAYGLEIISEHWEPGEMPSGKQWAAFQDNLEHHPANLMLWEGEPTEEVRQKLQEYNVNTVVFNPCANSPGQGDFLSVMRQNIESLEKYVEGM